MCKECSDDIFVCNLAMLPNTYVKISESDPDANEEKQSGTYIKKERKGDEHFGHFFSFTFIQFLRIKLVTLSVEIKVKQ